MSRNLVPRVIALCFFLFTSVAAFAQSPVEFTIAALPDTQFYSKSYPQIFTAETQWIANHAQQMNIQLVVGLGDIVDGGGEGYQWQNADLAYRILDGKVPYLAAIGNHDYDQNNPSGRTAYTKNFNAYFGPQRYAGKTWYKGQYPSGSNENFYSIITLGGKQYLILVLEVFPRNSALSWAAAVMKNHPGIDTIVVTHAYTYVDSTRMDRCDSNSAGSFAVGQDNDGEQVWEKFASKYPNITMVLSGHVVQGDGTGRRTDIGVNGNLVNAMLSDYQSWANGGDGYIRLITVKPALNQVVVRTYSPYLNQWLTSSHHQFTVPYKNSGLTSAMTTMTGKVKNISNCAAIAGATVSNGYASATTDAYGHYSLPAAAPSRYTLNVTLPGSIAPSQPAAALVYQPSPGKVMLAKSGAISGKVQYKGASLPGASVAVTGGMLRMSAARTTASDGSFSFGKVAYGTYQVTATAPGTTISATYTISVSAGGTTYVSFDLQ
ncbi:MAG TPA: carboxypeptidase regulatory-like domain-containing protein [Terriglobales bacterium]|nr:carboxypeptidase regulatory-like domain-containing protein [Terriglobales bacterium]